MKFNAISYILFAQDIARLAQFYTDCFGFKRVPNDAYKESGWLELAAGKDFKLCLHKAPKPGSASGNRNKLVLRVDDVAAARAHLIEHRVKMGAHHHWSDRDACDGRDPEGNKFQIVGPKTAP